jgi:hypothetical protein
MTPGVVKKMVAVAYRLPSVMELAVRWVSAKLGNVVGAV